MNKPIKGMIVTHFSFGSFLFFHGCSISDFRIFLEWKYLGGCADRTADEEPNDDLEVNGEENGSARGMGDISSPDELLLLVSEVSGIGVVAVVEVEVGEILLPRCREPSSIFISLGRKL